MIFTKQLKFRDLRIFSVSRWLIYDQVPSAKVLTLQGQIVPEYSWRSTPLSQTLAVSQILDAILN